MKVIIQEKESLLVSCVAGVTKTSLLYKQFHWPTLYSFLWLNGFLQLVIKLSLILGLELGNLTYFALNYLIALP